MRIWFTVSSESSGAHGAITCTILSLNLCKNKYFELCGKAKQVSGSTFLTYMF